MQEQPQQTSNFQQIKVKGNQLVDRIRDIVEEGNARRIRIRKDGRTVMEFPLSVGVGGATAAVILAPTLAAVGAFAALVSDVDVEIERIVKAEAELPEPTDGGGGTSAPGGTPPF